MIKCSSTKDISLLSLPGGSSVKTISQFVNNNLTYMYDKENKCKEKLNNLTEGINKILQSLYAYIWSSNKNSSTKWENCVDENKKETWLSIIKLWDSKENKIMLLNQDARNNELLCDKYYKTLKDYEN